MRYVLLLLLAAVTGYGVLQVGKLDPDNYVKMYIGNYVVEISVVQFSILILITVCVLYVLIRSFRLLWKSPKIYSNWRKRQAGKSADAALGSGYLALVKGDWKHAEKRLTAKSDHSSVPYINYLAAAQAAQEQGRLESRDEYLNAAYKAAPKERLAIGLTKARLHQSAGQLDQALATLEDIAPLGAKNAQFTAMLMQTYQQLGDWQGAKALMPAARKQNALPSKVLDELYTDIHSSVLSSAADKSAAWRELPRDQRKKASNIVIYAADLLAKGNGDSAEKLIRTSLKSTWSDELVHLYGSIQSAKPAKLRRNVEGWLMARPENAELNLAAGRFALVEKNADLAKEYLQKAIKFGQLPQAYSLLGEAYEASNDSGRALQLYRAGILALSQIGEAKLINASDAEEPSVIAGDLVVSNTERSV